MTLGDQQRRFPPLHAKLVLWAYEQGYELSYDEAMRTQTEANANAASGAGITHSLHTLRLAIDMNLFKNKVLLTSVDDYRPLGEYWKSLDPDCCWGGDFTTRPDADHFSLTWMGVK